MRTNGFKLWINMKLVTLVFMLLVLAGCKNIPVTTMLQVSSINKQDFYALDANQIRSKVSVSEPFTINLAQTNLAVALETEEGVEKLTFPLTMVSEEKLPETKSVLFSQPARTEYTFKLSEEGIASFEETQETVIQGPTIEGSFSVGTGFNENLDKGQSIIFSISIQLHEEEGYFSIIENADIDFNQ